MKLFVFCDEDSFAHVYCPFLIDIRLLRNKTTLEAGGIFNLFYLALKTRLEVHLLLNFIS